MRVTIAAIGKAKPGILRDLYRQYVERSRWPVVLKEMEVKAKLPAPEMMTREAALLLEAVPAGARWRDAGTSDIAFVIGGADGLDESVRRRSDLLLAFGRATWPHMMVRGMLAEQLYRAQQILAGHPYHRE